jgi:ribonuclease R
MKKKKRGADALVVSIREYLSSKNYRPMGQAALFRKLNIPKNKCRDAAQAVTGLIAEGFVRVEKNKLVFPRDKKKSVQGIIRMHPRGFGFVSAEDSKTLDKDIFIPRAVTMGSVDGDLVEVEVLSRVSSKGPEGEVISILSRGRKTLGGTIVEDKGEGEYLAYVPILGPEKEVIVTGKNLKIGDRYLLEVISWEEEKRPTYCKPKQLIGNIDDATVDVQAAVKEFELRDTFTAGAVNEAKKYGTKVGKGDERADFRDEETFTIDPIDAKDYDDALSLSTKPNGEMTLLVHIADVSHYVKTGSNLDKESFARCNSTYFPGKCIPMLPEELSNELCSLKANVDRFAITVEMHFNKNGDLLDYGIDRSIIHSETRFSYEEAKEVLDGKKESPHKATLDNMVELCLMLKSKRSARGSVDLALPEVRLKIGKDGIPTGYEIVDYDITHQLVEEFMLKANEVVAHQLIEMGCGAVFRVHEEPASKDLEEFYKVARRLGFQLKSNPETDDICALFKEAKTSPHLLQLSIAFIRSMKLAIYSEQNVGHYGLGLEHYCHFTSPIRRYSDLIVHRLLFEEETDELSAVASRCSEKERMSWRAEQSVRTLKKLRYLETIFEKEPNKVYEMKVSKVKPFGISFVWAPIGVEGFIHISDLGKDYYEYNPTSDTLTGKRSGHTIRPGTEIKAMVEEINLIYLESTWRIV